MLISHYQQSGNNAVKMPVNAVSMPSQFQTQFTIFELLQLHNYADCRRKAKLA